jgi:GrpB-like predicted nucleotidyltransferase (UPF0157 family)
MDSETVTFVDEDKVRAAARALFEKVRARLEGAIPRACIEHVAGTAVPGSVTKGDVDIAVRVDPADFRRTDGVLAARYPRNEGSDRTAGFAAFHDPDAEPPLGIQLAARGDACDLFTVFRDMLIADVRLLESYNALKRSFDGASMDDYRAAKAQFVDAALDKSAPMRPAAA